MKERVAESVAVVWPSGDAGASAPRVTPPPTPAPAVESINTTKGSAQPEISTAPDFSPTLIQAADSLRDTLVSDAPEDARVSALRSFAEQMPQNARARITSLVDEARRIAATGGEGIAATPDLDSGLSANEVHAVVVSDRDVQALFAQGDAMSVAKAMQLTRTRVLGRRRAGTVRMLSRWSTAR